MKIINGLYTSAKVFTTSFGHPIDDYAVSQLQLLCDNPIHKDCKIRVMPDVHPGKVGTIGLTMTIKEAIMPNLVGIDIGCGMTLAKLKNKKIEFQKLDSVIRQNIPAGFSIRKTPHRFSSSIEFSELHCARHIRREKALLSLGTLGGGNHFIEIDRDENGDLYVVIHSGSRHLGKETTEYYLKEGQTALKSQNIQLPYELTFLEGPLMEQYLHDVQFIQEYAKLNREIILDELAKGMKWKIKELYSCSHNYIEHTGDTLFLRKGAISAKKGEKVIIPINMKDGVILGTGKGNPDWNLSAPHGAGRIMKREDIKSHYTVSSFKTEMKGIYSSCISKDTLDEAPFAYRSIEEIQTAIKDTISIEKILKPVYNFKAGSNS